MSKKTPSKFDEIGDWSRIKLDIIKKYASAYSKIFSTERQARFSHVYIDGFAGPGLHVAKDTGDLVPGSPLNALHITPRFDEFFLIDLDGDKVESLRQVIGSRTNVHVYHGDCNKVLLAQVFPKVRYEDYRRGLCLLDPYGLHLDWGVIAKAGQMRTIDMFLNFPIMDMNRNALWRNPDRVSEESVARMTAFWGDATWRQIAYRTVPRLFDTIEEKKSNKVVAEAFRDRLKAVAGFKYVPRPLPMRNAKKAVVYYLFFASQNPDAKKIAEGIFRKYASGGG